MLKLIGLLTALVLAGAVSPALADATGNAKGVNPAAAAVLDGATRTLVVGSDVFIGDVVETGDKGQVQILFADNTELVVGPKSSLKIEDYLIRNDGSAGRLAVNMLSGFFRFSTGDAPKDKYEIDTPTGTIGVRGTGFDVFVTKLATWILLYDGRLRFCTTGGICKDLAGFCAVGHMVPGEAQLLGDSREINGDTHKLLKQHFIYADNQSRLLRAFWMPKALDCVHLAPNLPTILDSGIGDNRPADPTPPVKKPPVVKPPPPPPPPPPCVGRVCPP